MGLAEALAGDCPEPASVVADAEQLVLFADLDGARAALLRVDAALACSGPVEPDVLAHLWLVEGALLMDEDSAAAAATSFAAARRVAPTVWIDGLGPERRAAYDDAVPATGVGQLAIDAPAGTYGTTWVDGAPETSPVSVRPGEHLIQYGAEGRSWFARIVLVSADQLLHVAVPAPLTAAPEAIPPDATPVIEAPPPAPPRPPSTRAYPHVAVGVDVALPKDFSEPTMLTAPLEVGGGASGKRLWARAAAFAAPVFIGDEPSSPFVAGAHLASGFSLGPVDLGLLGGFSWPGRPVGQVVVGLAIPGAPVEIEARAGFNLRSDQPFEPVGGLVLAFPGAPAGGRRR